VKLGAKGAALIKKREQLRLVAYKPTPQDKWTIGWGHTGKDVYEGLTWVLSQAEDAFQRDTAWAVTAVLRHTDVALNQNQFDALVAFVFNVGETAFAGDPAHGREPSTLLRLVNSSRFADAAQEFAKWNHQNGVVLGGLTARRADEAQLFATPI
jgi:lysozyme